MNILFYCPFKFDLKNTRNKSLGGIETLNIELCKELSKDNFKIYLATICKKTIKKYGLTNIPINYLSKKKNSFNFDIIVSSNEPNIFSQFKKSKKILWMHNPLNIEKSIRKKKILSILLNKITAVFVSKYLMDRTSTFYLFYKKKVFPNFLFNNFLLKKINTKRQPIFIWSVQRIKGLDRVIELWIKNINLNNKNARLYIFGINNYNYHISKKNLNKYNIFFFGRVSKDQLRSIYNKSLAMICLGYDETFCLNALEANSCGLPIITFGKTALKDYSISNYNSIIAKNFTDLENKIFYLLSLSNHEKDKLIKNSFNHSKKFRLNIISKLWIKLFKNI